MKDKILLTDVILVINYLVPGLELVHIIEDGVEVGQFVFQQVSTNW